MPAGTRASVSSHSGDAKLIAAGDPARRASPRRWRAWCGARAGGAAPWPRPSRRSRSSSAKRSRIRRRPVLTSTRAPVSGSTSIRWPTAGSSVSRGSTTSIASTEWRTRSEPSGRSHARWSRKSEMSTTRPGWPASLPTRASASASASGSSRPSTRDARLQPAAQRDHAGPRPARRRHLRGTGAEGDQADAARAAHAEAAEHQRRPLGHVGLEPPRGAERHRGRDVEHDPRRQRPLGHVQAHVGRAGARAGGGVDVAHVVADLVRAQLGELGAQADAGGAAVARAGSGPRDG